MQYNETMLTELEAKEIMLSLFNSYLQTQGAQFSCSEVFIPDSVVNSVSGYNTEFDIYHIADVNYTPHLSHKASINVERQTFQSKLTPKNNARICFLKIPVNIVGAQIVSDDTIFHYLMLSNTADCLTVQWPYAVDSYVADTSGKAVTEYTSSGSAIKTYEGTSSGIRTKAFNNILINDDYIEKLSALNMPASSKYFITQLKALGTFYGAPNYKTSEICFINQGYVGDLKGSDSGGVFCLNKINKLPFPVFDYTNYSAAANYLLTGDDTGKIDPFDEGVNPDIEYITDFKTDFDFYINRSNNVTSVQILSSNQEYYEKRGELAGLYQLHTWGYEDTDRYSSIQFPQINISPYNANSNIKMRFESIEEEHTGYSGSFQVFAQVDSTKQSGVRISTVKFSEDGSSNWVDLEREIVGETYIYTASSGEKLTIHFSSFTFDDLKDLVDDGYINGSDEENDTSGSDTLALFGAGYGTYKITDGDFELVNEAMWSTDWSTLFKPTSTSPTQCIISSKRIPFTQSGTLVGKIPIANQEIAVNNSSKINPVKSFTLPTVTMPIIYGNFVDMFHTKVRIYLPFIGWKELPAEAVMSKAGRLQVGLIGDTKILGFKYIVDFVDGNVKCIISVNGTERWMFDGTCAVDVPITSDNHSAAVVRSSKSIASTVLTVAGGMIAGASGNEVGALMAAGSVAAGAISAVNALPSYSYQASCSISGLVEASANHHIMIIIEYPVAWYPNGTEHKVGLPCELYMSLGSLRGYTKTVDADVSGVNCTQAEAEMLKSLLDSGVYL